jgi:hypothetical protein
MLGNSGAAEQLVASQDGLGSMVLVFGHTVLFKLRLQNVSGYNIKKFTIINFWTM